MLEDPEFEDTVEEQKERNNMYFHSMSSQVSRPHAGYDLNVLENKHLKDEDFLTIPATIAAYSLGFKRWGLIDVEKVVHPIDWRNDLYDMLQMETTQKEMVRGIIESHSASSSSFDDFVPGKGRGLVFLLHGPPGCGKTLTAGKFPISCPRHLLT